MRVAVVVCGLCLLMLGGCELLQSATPTVSGQGVPEVRMERLKQGVNLSHWFAQQRISRRRLRNHITAEDLELIRSLGFQHVRLPVDPNVLFNTDAPDTLRDSYLTEFDAALDLIRAADLAVIIEIHPSDTYKQRLIDEPGFMDVFTRCWGALARYLRVRDPDYVFLEVLNEPTFSNRGFWSALQQRVLAEMRLNAPDHTLVATGHAWSSMDELLLLTPTADANVVYTFHFYTPHTFTHQGARWGTNYWRYVRELPYPSSPEAVAEALSKISRDEARRQAEQYGRENWNADRIDELIEKVADWSEEHDVQVVCTEFGVYRDGPIAEADRHRWIHDVRTALERHSIGWTVWDYADSFGLVDRSNGGLEVDEGVIEALGL